MLLIPAFIFVTAFTRGVRYLLFSLLNHFFPIRHNRSSCHVFKCIQGLFYYQCVLQFLHNTTEILAFSEEFTMHSKKKDSFIRETTTFLSFSRIVFLFILYKWEHEEKKNGNYFLFIVVNSY